MLLYARMRWVNYALSERLHSHLANNEKKRTG